MDQAAVRTYVEKFFILRGCEIIDRNDDEIQVILNEETDKDLEYRPFYWTYVENAKIKPELLKKRYIFNQNVPQKHFTDEYLFFGSRRLHQIFLATQKRGKYVRLYEDLQPLKNIRALHPWLMVNYKVEYVCDTKKEEIHSLGFNLITGIIQEKFYEKIKTLSLTPRLPNYMFTPTPLFSLQSGLKRLEEKIVQIISKEDHTWADLARQKFDQEVRVLQEYYNEVKYSNGTSDNQEEKNIEEERRQRLEELEWQYLPRINVIPIQFALMYLYTNPK